MITLEQFTKQDFKHFISWFNTPEELIQACGRTFSFPPDEAQLEKYVKGEEMSPPVRRIFKVVDSGNNNHIGNLTLERINLTERSAAIACVIIGDDNYKGKGLCEIIIKKVIDIAFNEIGLDKLTLNVFDFNMSAIRCYEKAGFEIVDRTNVEYLGKEYINVKMTLIKS